MSGSEAQPLYLSAESDPILGFLQAPAEGPRSGLGVVIVPPFGWEEICSYRSRRAWSEQLAELGHSALRIDLPGTGDSGGSARAKGRVAAWRTGVAAAARELRELAGCERVAAIGIGFGGAVALCAACEEPALDDLVLWGVPARGRRLVRELRAFARMDSLSFEASGDPEASGVPDGGLEAGGFLLTAETLEALEGLDLGAVPLPGAADRRVLLLERDGMKVDARLREHLESSGADVAVAPGPGYNEMTAHPQAAKPPREVFATVASWLADAPRAGSIAPTDRASQEVRVELLEGGVPIRERVVAFASPGGRLVGVLAEPAAGSTAELCAVLPNAGALRRIGPGRMWVEIARRWAARGVPTLRLDVEGIGDADGDEAVYEDTAALYAPKLTQQVRAGISELESLGLAHRFVVLGLCSGAYWAFHAALEDDRVVASFLLNVRALIWDDLLVPGRDARRALQAVEASSWSRVLSGEIPPARLWEIARSALAAPVRARRQSEGDRRRGEEIEAAFDRARDAGKRVVFVFGEGEDVDKELERDGNLPPQERWPNLELELVPYRDHDFRALRSQRFIHELLDRLLERELVSGRARMPRAEMRDDR